MQGPHEQPVKITDVTSTTWVQGETYDVAWTSAGLQQFLTLVLQPGDLVLSSNAPTSGRVTVTLPVNTESMSDGAKCRLQLRTPAGDVLAQSKTITVHHPTAVSLTKPVLDETAPVSLVADADGLELVAVWDKGASYYVNWKTAGKASTVSLQFYHGSPHRRTVDSTPCVPFKDPSSDTVYNDCVTNPLSSYFGQCATAIDIDGHWQAGGFCQPLREHFQLLWSADAKSSSETHYLSIPGGSLLPAVGDEYYLLVAPHGQPEKYTIRYVYMLGSRFGVL